MKTIFELAEETEQQTIRPWGDDAHGVVIREPMDAERRAYDKVRDRVHAAVAASLDGGDEAFKKFMATADRATIEKMGQGGDLQTVLDDAWAHAVIVQFDPEVDDVSAAVDFVLARPHLRDRLVAELAEVGLPAIPLYGNAALSLGLSSAGSKVAKGKTRKASK